MSQTASIWLVIVLGLVGANLPFANERFLAVVPLRERKSLALRVAEMFIFYLAVGAVGLLLEKRVGQIAPQGWEFYAVTGALFITFAFPGFIWRYLRRRH